VPNAKANPIAPHPGYPPGWHTETTSKPDAFHNLLAFYHKQKRWPDALQLMGQHRRHLATPALVGYAVKVLEDAARTKADPKVISLIADYIRTRKLDAKTTETRKSLLDRLDTLAPKDKTNR